MNREEYINLAINLNKFMYGDFKKLYRFKTREEDERAVLTIAAIVLNNPLHNEKHLAEILESFSIVGEYEISFVHLGIVMGFISMYKDEVEECENLTEEDADYIIDIDGIKFYIFNT